jgi:6-phosphogluconolactonase (cycloisomerase 2 family)
LVSSYLIGPTGPFTPFPDITFSFGSPGPNPARQDAPHPHQIILDPTGKYVLVPDLGSDAVHVFYIDPTTFQLCRRDSLSAEGGSGPRHGVFGKDGSFFYLVSELANTVTVYKVTTLPGGAGIEFDFVQKTDSFAGAFAKSGKPVPATAAVSEIALSVSISHAILHYPAV